MPRGTWPVTVMPSAWASAVMAWSTESDDAAVDLDLLEAGVVIAPHPGDALLGRAGAGEADAGGSVTIDDAGGEEPRPDALAAVEHLARAEEEVELVADIARGGDAGGEVDRSPLHLGVVGVHLPEAGQDGGCRWC